MNQQFAILKYPSTSHLAGSRLQKGDDDSSQVPYSALVGKHLVIEEKMDGANSGLRFSLEEELLLQSRGHYLTGGGMERHFNLMKAWACAHEYDFLKRFGTRYITYGEWMTSKHTVFYDKLPHYFLEFDIWDTEKKYFLDTQSRKAILSGSPIVSVPVLYEGVAPKHLKDLLAMVQPSLAKTSQWRDILKNIAQKQNLNVERVLQETETSDLSEGLYIKVEENGQVVQRLKWVRYDFLQTMTSNDSHWLSRPIIPNQLRKGVDIYATTPQGW